MGRKPPPLKPESVLLFGGISEKQWRFLQLRSFADSDTEAARAMDLSPRVVQGWKSRSDRFRTLLAFALAQPRLFASGEFVWAMRSLPDRAKRILKTAVDERLSPVGAIYSAPRDEAFSQTMRRRRLEDTGRQDRSPPLVDLEVPGEHRRSAPPPVEPSDAERALAAALGVDHAVVLGYWNGQPGRDGTLPLERAVDVVREFTPGFRDAAWYPNVAVYTSSGLMVVQDGEAGMDSRCRQKRRHRCPLTDHKYGSSGDCPYWQLALGAWLDQEPPARDTRSPICHVDFAITRLLAYTAAASMRRYPDHGWSAHFPVITFERDEVRSYWHQRVARWNALIDNPWHRLRLIKAHLLIEAIAQYRARDILGAQASGREVAS